MEDLVRAEDVAKFLGVAKVTVYKWAETGLLPYYRLHKKSVRFRREDIEDFANRSRVEKKK